MEQRTEDEKVIWRYLLGEVAVEEQTLVEKRLLTDRLYLNQLLRLEEELTDRYVRGELAGSELERFERHFALAPERREAVEFARALNRHLSTSTIGEPAGKRLADRVRVPTPSRVPSLTRGRRASEALVLCAMLLLAIATGWLLVETARLRKQISSIPGRSESEARELELKRQLDEQRSRNDELVRVSQQDRDRLALIEQEIARRESTGGKRGPSVATLSLVAGLSRAEGRVEAVHLPAYVERLRLTLELDGASYARFRAEVQTAEGKTVWSQVNLKAQQTRSASTVVIQLPAARLTKSDYLVRLSGRAAGANYERAGVYFFRVVRE